MSHIGQYFTTNSSLKDKVVEFILNEPLDMLPSVGRGDLVVHVLNRYPHITLICTRLIIQYLLKLVILLIAIF